MQLWGKFRERSTPLLLGLASFAVLVAARSLIHPDALDITWFSRPASTDTFWSLVTFVLLAFGLLLIHMTGYRLLLASADLAIIGAVAGILLPDGDRLHWLLILLAAMAAVAPLLAWQLGHRCLRWWLAASVLVVTVVVSLGGRDVVRSERLASARAAIGKLDAELADLTETSGDAQELATRFDDLDTDLAEVCSDAGGGMAEPKAGRDRSERCLPVSIRTVESLAEVDRELAQIRLDLALLRRDLGDEKAKVDETELALKEAELAVSGSNKPEGGAASGVDVEDAIAAGGQAAFELIPGVKSNGPSLILGAGGWAVLGALAVLGYRWSERLAADIGTGPIAIDFLPVDIDDFKALEPEFRVRLLQNIDEPGPVPGAVPEDALTDLLPAAGALSAQKEWLKAVQHVVAPRPQWKIIVNGYRGTADGGHSASTPATVSVVIISGWSRSRTHQIIVAADALPLAVSRAAYSVAAWIINESRSVPDWAAWPPSASDALAAYTEHRRNPDPSRDLPSLQNAFRLAPRSANVALLVGHAHAMAGQHLEAVIAYARGAAAAPNFTRATYRLAIGLALLQVSAKNAWWPLAQRTKRQELADLLSQMPPSVVGAGPAEVAHLLDPDRFDQRVLSIADNLLAHVEADLQPMALTERWLRGPADRSYARQLRSRRTARIHSTQAARCLIARRRTALTLMSSATLATDPSHRDWERTEVQLKRYQARFVDSNALYNLACAKLAGLPPTAPAIAEAIRLLERARDAPGSEALARPWLLQDPDLKALHRNERFLSLVDNFRDGEISND